MKIPLSSSERVLFLSLLYLINFAPLVRAPAAEPETIDLNFSWPDGLRLRVEGDFTRELPGKNNSATSTRCSYLWTLSRHERGHALKVDDYTLVRSEPVKSLDPLLRLEHATLVASLRPVGLLVGSGAEVVGLLHEQEWRQAFVEEVQAVDLGNDADVDAMRAHLTSDAVSERRAIEDWDRMVFTWAGATGVSLDVPGFESVEDDLGDGRSITREFEFRARRAPARDRVLLQVRERISSEEFKKLGAGVFGSNILKQLEDEPGEVHFESTSITECDPATLIPVSYHKTKEIIVTRPDGSIEVSMRQEWTWTFRQLPAESTVDLSWTKLEVSEEESASVVADVRRIVFALQENDLDGILALTHPHVIKLGGGAQRMRGALENAMSQFAASGLVIEEFEPTDEPDFFSHEGIDYVIVRTRSRMMIKGTTLDSHSFMLGSRTSENPKWAYVDGSKLHGATRRMIFPGFPEDKPLPLIERKPIP